MSGRVALIGLSLLVLIAFLAILSLTLGAASVDPFAVLTGRGDPAALQILWHLRLPRLFLALAVGANFGLAGLIVQIVLRNPLAEPGVLGVSAGASLAVVAALLLSHGALSVSLGVPLVAFGGAVAAGAAILWLCGGSGDPRRLVLGGVVFGMALNALVMAVIVGFGAGRAELALLWLTGSLYGRGYDQLWPVLACGGVAALLLPAFVRPLGLLRFGDDQARSAGLEVRIWRPAALLLAMALAASAVSAAGPIGFVGLVVPHFARLLTGAAIAPLIWVTALSGAAVTLMADVVGRAIAPPLEIPVGAVTGLIGVPIFLLLLQRQSRRRA
ncbi:iron ABC transporter permease [Paracoccus caeni]|uniref:Iron ABC transporter permease n=1 Tax=Paracoccus caeni TaxID=657651 RepID=A0A934VWB6_9RHOB|nr:iron ABC transporter permease [Paracoccus caeni]MBK4217876.1 iron ABC transporter permease [Paracoccus caeni]